MNITFNIPKKQYDRISSMIAKRGIDWDEYLLSLVDKDLDDKTIKLNAQVSKTDADKTCKTYKSLQDMYQDLGVADALR